MARIYYLSFLKFKSVCARFFRNGTNKHSMLLALFLAMSHKSFKVYALYGTLCTVCTVCTTITYEPWNQKLWYFIRIPLVLLKHQSRQSKSEIWSYIFCSKPPENPKMHSLNLELCKCVWCTILVQNICNFSFRFT